MKTILIYVKNLLLLTCFFSILSSSYAQTGSLTYKLDIERQKSTYLRNMYLLANGDNLVSSYDIGDTIKTSLRFVRIKPNGTISWSRTYIESNDYQSLVYQYSVVAAATNDNGFIAAIRLDSSAKYGLGVVLFKCDSSGNIEWKKKLITADHSPTTLGPITQTKDGGYYFIVDGYGLPHLEKLDKNGNLIWSTAFDPSYSDYGSGTNKLAEAADGGALLSTYNIGCEYYCIWYDLFKFQKDGNPAWVISFDPDFDFGTKAYHLSEDSTGTIRMITGGNVLSFYDHGYGYGYVTIQPNATEAKASIIKYDLLSLQHFLKTKKITTPIGGFFSRSAERVYFNFNKNWSLIVTTEKEKYNNKKTTAYLNIERYDSIGRICPDFTGRTFDSTVIYRSSPIYRSTFQVVKTPALLITNSNLFSTLLPNDDSMLCNGVAPAALTIRENKIASSVLKQTSTISIYPNPANNYIQLNFTHNKSTAAQIQIVNVEGKIIKTFSSFFTAGTATKTYDVSYLPKGIYLLQAITSATRQSVKFVKD